MIRYLILGTLLLAGATQGWAQTTDVGVPVGATDQPMVAPPPVNTGGESVAFTSEMEKSNYLRGGVSFQGAYSDNVFNSTPAQSDETYTILPTIAFDMTRSRLQWDLNYSPGFTLYQNFTSENQVDHIFSTNLQYRMSPHVTLTLQDNLAKTPSFSGLLQPGSITSTTVVQTPAFFVAPALIDTLSNNGSGQVTYQFAPNEMLGFGGSSSQLYYLGDVQTPGLSDSNERGAQAFYEYRLGGKHYFGMNYDFQDMVSHPINLDTQVHSGTLFYTFYLNQRVSFSLFGGAQHADTEGAGFPSLVSWSPTEGGGLNLQGVHNGLALNASRTINAGGGLEGPVRSYSANAAFRHQFTPNLNGTIEGVYSQNDVLQLAGLPNIKGNTFLFSGSLHRSFGRHFSAELGYSRINQNYKNVPAVSSNPDVDRAWVTVSYQFERPLGR